MNRIDVDEENKVGGKGNDDDLCNGFNLRF